MIDDVIEAIKEGAASVHYYDYYCERSKNFTW